MDRIAHHRMGHGEIAAIRRPSSPHPLTGPVAGTGRSPVLAPAAGSKHDGGDERCNRTCQHPVGSRYLRAGFLIPDHPPSEAVRKLTLVAPGLPGLSAGVACTRRPKPDLSHVA